MTTLKDILTSFAAEAMEITKEHNEDDLLSLEDKMEYLVKEYLGEI